MRHVKRVSLGKAQQCANCGDFDEMLDQVFGFVLELVTAKGKEAETS